MIRRNFYVKPEDCIECHLPHEARHAGKFVELVREQGVLAGVRAERGCLQYEYFAALEDPDKLFLLECWEDEACLDAHAHSENMERLKQLKEQCALDTQIRRY